MPFVRISVPDKLSNNDLQQIADAVHESLVATFEVPVKDRFQVVTKHAAHELIYAPEYLGIQHSDPVAFIQITCNDGRSVGMKKALFARLAAAIAAGGVIAPANVIVNLVEVKKENWSFGDGVAQYAP